jgi:hypothetical protein
MKNVVAGGGPEEASAFFYLISVEFGYGSGVCPSPPNFKAHNLNLTI